MSASKKVVALRKAGRPRSTAPRPDIVVEKNVPLPVQRSRYPFADMKVGDSFTVANEKNAASAVRGSLTAWKRRHKGWSYATRADGDMLRVWRTA